MDLCSLGAGQTSFYSKLILFGTLSKKLILINYFLLASLLLFCSSLQFPKVLQVANYL